MDKSLAIWLRNNGFEKIRDGEVPVWRCQTGHARMPGDRAVSALFELSEENGRYRMSVTLEAEGTVPEDYSCGSAWAFTARGNDAKALCMACVDGLRSSLAELDALLGGLSGTISLG